MDFAMWAYPWDLLDEGVETVGDRLAEIGVNEINLATNYHTVQAFLPHNPERKTFFAHASSYFHPGDGYGRLQPVPNETMGDDDWLAAVADRIADAGLTLNSWTIGCHNSRLGMHHPDVTLTTPFGDSLVFGLCPSNPDVQEYLVALACDLDDRAPFQRLEFESLDYFYGTGFGWHHDKYHTRLGTLGEFLFGLCFCSHCEQNAAATGIDVDAARRTCRETITALAEGRLPHDIDLTGWFDAHPSVKAYADVRMDTLTSVFEDVAAAVSDVDLGYYVGLLDVEHSWMHGADLHALADVLDYYTVIAYEPSAAGAVARMQTADELTPEIPLHAGLLPGHPEVHDEDTVVRQVDGVVDAGAPRVSFYNYGLLPERNLDWVGTATEAWS